MANVVLTTVPSSSGSGFYEICQDTSNDNKIWCRIGDTNNACMSWGVGWKRQGFAFHTCKHVREATRTLGLRLEVRGDAQYIVGGVGGIVAPGAAPGARNVITRTVMPRGRTEPARTARPAQTYVPSLEQVRKAIPATTQSNDLVRRGSRRRPDDE